jgi:hypothetical protein
VGGLGVAGKRRLTPKVKAFFDAYGGVAKLNATAAARVAFAGGADKANRVAADMKRRWPDLFEKVEEEYRSKIRMSDDELDQHLSEISRDTEHKDRLRALELIARMKGRLNDKLRVEVDRRGMLKEVEELLKLIPQSIQVPVIPSQSDDKQFKPAN